MKQYRWVIPLLGTILMASSAVAEIAAKRGTVEADFLSAAQGKAELLTCMIAPQDVTFEACAFQGGEAATVTFLFDAESKAFKAVMVFFAEKEADLGIELGQAALKASNYAQRASVNFRLLMEKATLTDTDVKLSGNVTARLRKTPPSLYALVFMPSGDNRAD